MTMCVHVYGSNHVRMVVTMCVHVCMVYGSDPVCTFVYGVW